MGFWTCQGCGTALDDGHPDVITGHVHDCPPVDGAGQPLFGPEAQCRHCGRPGTLAIRRTSRSGQASVIPTDEQRHPAVTRYLQAVNRFSEEIISWVSAAIRAAFPRAAR